MKTPIEQYVIDKVREKRLAQKMSQATLAYCLGVSRGFIGDVENPNQRAKYNLCLLYTSTYYQKYFQMKIEQFRIYTTFLRNSIIIPLTSFLVLT